MSSLDLTRDVVKPPLYDRINAVIPKGIGVWGYEGMRLARVAAAVPDNGVIVEIGSFRGRSAAFMAAALPQGSETKIYCIDVWEDTAHMKAADIGLKKLGLRGFVELIRGKSLDVVKEWDKAIDLLFIDGAHDYHSVRDDFRAWLPFVKTGGMVLFHDYQTHWPGVIRLVEEVSEAGLITKIGLHKFLWSGIKK